MCHSTFLHVSNQCNAALLFIPLMWMWCGIWRHMVAEMFSKVQLCWAFKVSAAPHEAVWRSQTSKRAFRLRIDVTISFTQLLTLFLMGSSSGLSQRLCCESDCGTTCLCCWESFHCVESIECGSRVWEIRTYKTDSCRFLARCSALIG